MATIWSSVVKEDLEALRELLEEGGVGVNSINDLGETPLHLAASRGLEDVAKVGGISIVCSRTFDSAALSSTKYFFCYLKLVL